MKKLSWDESLETRIFDVDIQHRNLFNILKILNDAIENGKSALVIKDIIDGIERYADDHIQKEERMLRKYNVLKEDHLNEHHNFRTNIKKFKEKYSTLKKDKVFSKEIYDYLYEWITGHIIKRDLDDIKYIREQIKDEILKNGKK